MRHTTQQTNQDTGSADPGHGPRGPVKFGMFGRRGGAVGIVILAAALAAGGLAAVRLLGEGQGTARAGAGAMDTPAAGSRVATGGLSPAAAGMPQVAATPQVAAMPKHGTGAKHTPGASPSVKPSTTAGTASASQTPPTSPSSPASATPTPANTGAGSATCQHPQYQTSDPSGMWNLAPYFVMNNMWGISGYNVSQTLYGCSYGNWYVVATMDNSKGDGAVKTYPNSHRDFDSAPAISSFSSITSTFAETSPGTGIYEDAYDIWLNGVASNGSSEVMIWNDNHGQVPSGSVQGTVTLGGRSYTVWRNGNYIAFEAKSNFTSATLDLLGFFKWLMSKGWLASNSTLNQVDYGVELVSTNGVPATFTFSNFSVNAS